VTKSSKAICSITLSEDTREAFERHYFDCDQCLGELQALEAIRDELRQTPEPQRHMRPRFNVWLPVAAVAAVFVLAVTAMFWRSAPPALPPPKVAVQPGVTTPPLPPPTAASPDTSKPSLEQLARVEPAPYEPLTFRAVPDEATTRFQQGMNRYGQADFRGAITDLKAAAIWSRTLRTSGSFLECRNSSRERRAVPSIRCTLQSPSAIRPISRRPTSIWRRRTCGVAIRAQRSRN
jgi:hypothetical protein